MARMWILVGGVLTFIIGVDQEAQGSATEGS